jgi:phosphoglycolate phosphatase
MALMIPVHASDVDGVVQAIHRCTGPGGHVIWDWNGTLLDDVDHAIGVMNRLLEEHGLPSLDRSRYSKVFDFPVRRYYDTLGFDYDRESFESLCNRFVEHFLAGASELLLFPLMHAALHALKAQGFVQSILSATEQRSLERMIEGFGLQEIFACVFGNSDHFATSKLERGRGLLRSTGLDSARTVLIGDTLHDLEVADALGTHLVLVDHGHHSRARLREARLTRPARRLHLLSCG